MRIFKKLTSVILCLSVLLSFILLSNLIVSADSDTNTVTQPQNDDYIYYSDLFYGYDTAYLNSVYLSQYSSDVNSITSSIFNDYVNSPKYKWSVLETAISSALSAKEFFTLLSDAYLETDFNYQDAVDSANIMVAEKLLGDYDTVNAAGKVGKITKRFDKLLGLYREFEENFDIYQVDEVVTEKFFAMLSSEGVYVEISYSQLITIKEIVIPELKGLKKVVSGASDALEVLKSISVGLMLEDIRLEMLDDVIANSSDNETVYNGFTRLKSQLVNGFASYFVKTYVTDEAVGAIFKAVQKAVTSQSSAYGFVSACLEVASWVTFDVLFDIPDMDDMLTQMVLREYSSGLRQVLRTKASSFNTQFSSDDVLAYESIFEVFIAASNAALDASEALSLSSNEAALQNIKNTYSSFSYQNYVENLISFISSYSKDKRVTKSFDTWTISRETTLMSASDTIESNALYTFYNNELKADVTVDYYANLIIASGSSYTIDGNLSNGTINIEDGATLTVTGNLSNGTISIEDGATLTVNGDLKYGNSLTNDGTLICNGNFGYYWGNYDFYVYQNLDTAKMYIRGDASLFTVNNSKITGGTVIFDGQEQQEINDFKVYNSEILNKNGIIGDLHISGNLDLHGNPNDGVIYIYDGATFTEGSDYKNVYVPYDIVLATNIKANVTVDYYANLIIASGSSYTIDGNLSNGTINIEDGATLTVNGNLSNGTISIEDGATLTVNGDLKYGNSLTNDGTLICNGNFGYYWGNYDFYVYQNLDTAKMYIRGDASLFTVNNSKITGGTVIFDGVEQQTVENLKAPTIILHNTSDAGIVFSTTISPTVLFDHQGNNYTLYDNGKGSTFVDYDGDGYLDNVDLHPTVIDIIYGDFDFDEGVTSSDLVQMRKNLLDTHEYSDLQKMQLDLNSDGEVDIRDLIRLKRYLSGFDVPLGNGENSSTQAVLLYAQPAYLKAKSLLYK